MDVIRQEGETLEEYHEREVADVSATWTGLDNEGRESMRDHMIKVRPDPGRLYETMWVVQIRSCLWTRWFDHGSIAVHHELLH